jgi:hypothetical protein
VPERGISRTARSCDPAWGSGGSCAPDVFLPAHAVCRRHASCGLWQPVVSALSRSD